VRRATCLAIAMLGAAALIAERPTGISIYTWAREDLFAGPMGNDMERFNAGMAKVEDALQQDPKNANAIALKGFGTVFRATRALDAGNRAEFDRLYDEGIRLLDQAAAIEPGGIGVHSVYGATMLYWFAKLPAERRPHAAAKGLEHYRALYKSQEKFADQMPVHLKGELFAGLAEAERRNANWEQAKVWLQRIVSTMPGTPYARVAGLWLANPDRIPEASRVMCQTCHEPGRLDAVLATRKQP
jgi:tetratricopeptide (TPR) repeat protein